LAGAGCVAYVVAFTEVAGGVFAARVGGSFAALGHAIEPGIVTGFEGACLETLGQCQS